MTATTQTITGCKYVQYFHQNRTQIARINKGWLSNIDAVY